MDILKFTHIYVVLGILWKLFAVDLQAEDTRSEKILLAKDLFVLKGCVEHCFRPDLFAGTSNLCEREECNSRSVTDDEKHETDSARTPDDILPSFIVPCNPRWFSPIIPGAKILLFSFLGNSGHLGLNGSGPSASLLASRLIPCSERLGFLFWDLQPLFNDISRLEITVLVLSSGVNWTFTSPIFEWRTAFTCGSEIGLSVFIGGCEERR